MNLLLDDFLRPYQFLAAVEIARFALHTPQVKEQVAAFLELPNDDLDELAGALDHLIDTAASEAQTIRRTDKPWMEEPEAPCRRERDGDGWWCLNDHTGCLHNDGNNTCTAPGHSLQPLEGATYENAD